MTARRGQWADTEKQSGAADQVLIDGGPKPIIQAARIAQGGKTKVEIFFKVPGNLMHIYRWWQGGRIGHGDKYVARMDMGVN